MITFSGVDVAMAQPVPRLLQAVDQREDAGGASPVLPPVATKHRRRAKENPPAILAASHDRGLSRAAAFARIAKRRAVETLLDIPAGGVAR